MNGLISAAVGISGAIAMALVTPAIQRSALTAQTSKPPGEIQLLAGYQHERSGGFDTSRGHIWKPGGIEIIYEIGTLANNEARTYRTSGKYLWFRQLVLDNTLVDVVMRDEETLLVGYFGAYANFRAHNIKSQADLADALLMVLTYDPHKGLLESGR
jgi:hypothetical protein